MPSTDPPALSAAHDLDLLVQILEVGSSPSMEAHEAKLGVPTGSLCKTLVVRRAAEDYVFILVSGGRRLDWPKVRRALDVDRASMATREQVLEVTGFIPGTVTALGSSHVLPVIVDQVASDHQRIAMGAGRSGVSAVVESQAFITAVDARVADVTVPST